MENKKALEQLRSIQKSILGKYPHHQLLTAEIFTMLIEMLSVDYKSISPGGKRLNIFNRYMLSILKKALDNNGHKNYMVDLINVFRDSIISKYLYNSFDNKADDLMSIINRLKNALFAWQGFEGCEWKRLERIENILR